MGALYWPLPKTQVRVCVVADLDLLWGQFLKMLDANMPEGVHVWISNIKQAVLPLLEKAMELLDVGQ